MLLKHSHNRHIFTALASLVVSFLIFSFGLHSIQVPHQHLDHPQATTHHGETDRLGDFQSLTISMHAAEKKLFAIATQLFLLSAVVVSMLYGNWPLFMVTEMRRLRTNFHALIRKFSLPRSYLVISLRRGLLNPKTH